MYEKRRDVIAGGVEPTDSDCEWPSDDEEGLAEGVEKINIEEEGEKKEEDEVKPAGVPTFWLTIFKNVDMLAEMVQEHDEAILESLTDVQVVLNPSNPMGFALNFHFKTNDYFSNPVLTKQYTMRPTPDEEDPLSYEGPEIISCTGCKIDWHKGKNVTVKVVKKTQKHQGRGQKRTITKTVQNDSFFNFFNPPDQQEGAEVDEDMQELLNADFEIGHFFKERVVPRAVLYFTGEALDDDDYAGEEMEDDDEEDDEDLTLE